MQAVFSHFRLCSGAVVTGYVRHSRFFLKGTLNETRRERQAPVAKTPRAAHVPHLINQQDRIAAVYANADVDGGSDAITLSDVTMVFDTGDGMKLHAVRLNPAAIAAWWLGSTATPFKGSKDSGAFFGVAIPLDL